MGLNMPAKTVVFTAVRKWDGDSHRYIGSGEYIQVSEEFVAFITRKDRPVCHDHNLELSSNACR